MLVLSRFARAKLAPVTSLCMNDVPVRFARVKLVRTNLEAVKLVLLRFAPVRFLPLQSTELQVLFGAGLHGGGFAAPAVDAADVPAKAASISQPATVARVRVNI